MVKEKTEVTISWIDPETGEDHSESRPLPLSIGRHTDADLQIDYPQISRNHVLIELKDEQIVVTDRNSGNGTFINGSRIQQTILHSGDTLTLGNLSLNLILPETESPPKVEEVMFVAVVMAPGSEHAQRLVRMLPISIGRMPSSDVVLDEPTVSRHHAKIEWIDSEVVLTHLSANGMTLVDGDSISTKSIMPGDAQKIEIGNCTFLLDTPDEDEIAKFKSANNRTMVLDLDNVQHHDSDSGASTFEVKAGKSEAAFQADLVAPVQDERTTSAFVDRFTQNDQAAPNSGTIVYSDPDLPAAFRSAPSTDNRTIVFDPDDDSLRPIANPERSADPFPPRWFDAPVVSIDALRNSQYQLDEAIYLAVGGGMGSFVWVDNLVIYGVAKEDILVVGLEPKPYGRYRRLCQNSQIPDRERLRSNSDSTPDNIWGWPGYAVREIFRSLRGGDLANAAKVTWQIFAEPAFADTYTPQSANVFDSVDREAARIGWDQMWKKGSVRAIRKTDDGRYAIAYAQKKEGEPSSYRFAVANYLHLAIGYPGIRLLENLQEYRRRTGDFEKIVNAYEPHDHIYKRLAKSGGTVILRGRGIVASRILQRLYETRQVGGRIHVIHLMRSPKPKGNRYGRTEREVANHWEFQPFNWPKASWGGVMRVRLENATPGDRLKLLGGDQWGGTTTAERRDWRQIVETGLGEGWYEIAFGAIKRVDPNKERVTVTIGGKHAQTMLDADYVIDATGLESGIEAHPLLKDMLDTYGVKRNVEGRLEVTNSFEVTDLRQHNGKLFAAGIITLGGPYAPVDTFLGLHYSAQRSVETLVKQKAPGLKRMHMLRSYIQWTKWVRGVAP